MHIEIKHLMSVKLVKQKKLCKRNRGIVRKTEEKKLRGLVRQRTIPTE
jgi:hypothetical protein